MGDNGYCVLPRGPKGPRVGSIREGTGGRKGRRGGGGGGHTPRGRGGGGGSLDVPPMAERGWGTALFVCRAPGQTDTYQPTVVWGKFRGP